MNFVHPNMDIISLLIIEGHPLMRDALRILLQAEPGLVVIGVTSDVFLGIHLLSQVRPDVVVLGLDLPAPDSLGAIQEIIASCPEAKILAFSELQGEGYIQAAIAAGARGYLSKMASRARLIEAIRQVADGSTCLPPGCALDEVH
jgi:DNA-binding NarL/FixJ family response regulator